MSGFTGMDDDELWQTIERYLAYIPLPENRETVRRYLEERRANGIKQATLGIDVNALRSLGVFLGEKRFEDATKADMVRYFNSAVGKRNYRSVRADGSHTHTQVEVRLSFSTREKRKEVFKPFYRWLLGLDATDPIPQMKGIKSRKTSHENVPADQLLSQEDLRQMIVAARTVQQKAVIAVLYESGMRASEFCALNVGSVVFDQYGAVLTLPKDAPGLKTGARRVRVFDCVSYLHAWFEEHPQKGDPYAPLWLTYNRRLGYGRLHTWTLAHWVKRIAKLGGIKKHVHPHLFRHTAATERARMGWNEGQMRAFFGWAKGSEMPSWYVHLAGLDYENVEIERRGLAGRKPAGPALKPAICRACKAENPLTALYCARCRHPISPEIEAKFAEERRLEMREELAKMFFGKKKEEIAQTLIEAGIIGSG